MPPPQNQVIFGGKKVKNQNKLTLFFSGQRPKTARPRSSKSNDNSQGCGESTPISASASSASSGSPAMNPYGIGTHGRFFPGYATTVCQPFRNLWETVRHCNWTLPSGPPAPPNFHAPPNPPRDTAVSFTVTDYATISQPQFVISCAVENIPFIIHWLVPENGAGGGRDLLFRGPSDGWRTLRFGELKTMVEDGVPNIQLKIVPPGWVDRYIPVDHQHGVFPYPGVQQAVFHSGGFPCAGFPPRDFQQGDFRRGDFRPTDFHPRDNQQP